MLYAHLNDMIMYIVILRLRLRRNWRRSPEDVGRPSKFRRCINVAEFAPHVLHVAVSFSPRTANRVLSVWSNRVFPVAPPTRRWPGPAFVCTWLPNPAGEARAFDFFTFRRDHWFRRRPRRKSAERSARKWRPRYLRNVAHLPRLLSNFFVCILVSSQIHETLTGSD